MAFNVSRIDKTRPELWIPFLDDPDTRVKVRHLTQDEFENIIEAAIVTTFNPKTHGKEKTRDDKKYREMLVDAVVIDWEGFVDGDKGDAYPCTSENRHFLMEKSTDFRMVVMDAPLSLQKMLDIEMEQNIKNL
jgi:hypothetical protein